ncbi:MAG: hypothetical protein LKE24_05920 [Dialister sp.]|jgi:4-carboxymuconolactone decarboxylase|nr:hypothetical protein [Dialister sp.]
MKELSVFPTGEKNTAYAKYFIGQSYLYPLSTEQVHISNVTFEPGCRNNWHVTPPRRAADRSSSAPQAKDGTRNGASRQED